MKFSLIIIIITLLFFPANNVAFSQTDSELSKTLHVSFVDDVAIPYEVDLNSKEKFVLNQKYSWVRDQNSRYNLVAYSLDGKDFSQILRQPRGNFILDIPGDTSHSVVFLTAIQYPVNIDGVKEYSFSPKSPTNDNWFDVDSKIKILDLIPNEEGLIPYEIKNWDGPIIKQSQNSAEILVGGPIKIQVEWQPNYFLLALYFGLPIAGGSAFFVAKKRISISKHIIQSDDKVITENYREKIHEFLKQKSFEKLSFLLTSESITNDKYLEVKETLWGN